MSFDGITLKSIVSELNNCLLDGKVNKIYEPSKNEIILGIYSNGVNYALNINISPNSYRLHLTTHSKPNPLNAPGFCMLLRKHLTGSKIKKIYTMGLERIAILELECYNDLNDLIRKKLIIELMGKHSNIILLNENNRIIDSLRHLDTYSNSYRDILPARDYVFPTSDKLDFYSMNNFDAFYNSLNECTNCEDLISLISCKYTGISNSYVKNTLKVLDIDTQINKENIKKFYDYTSSLLNKLGTTEISCITFNNDYSIVLDSTETNLQINFFIDDFYFEKEDKEIFLEYRNNLSKLVLLTLKKVNKKLLNINKKLQECNNMDKYKLYGELLIANLYRFKNESESVVNVENYYDNNNMISIPLDPRYSISDNASIYFKKYNKLKNALEIVGSQKQETQQELNYIESIIYELESAKNVADIDEIYSEISDSNIFENIRKRKSRNVSSKYSNKKYVESIHPLTFKIDGYIVYVGKNNKQNDYLTTKFAKKDDIWFHTKDIHGSHVILKTEGKIPEDDVLAKCASLAAYFSKAKLSSNVPVDYTYVKYVKKPSGSKPGMVIYTNNKTLNVNPRKED